ncbi:P-loop containing nucleoside triphosphate hydrolase protein [Rhizopus microsporus var. microsporus]|uniref:P-loop containing nucleoside triphosphate hydrolase protein n=1 Tax=Rhizopus microsporus var. microsporus TaxID=86635 RepID=A0A1X0RCP8_RHIZD|nr:P-loop containing nucleoside triphosphate hydrolase protein [Rhizopus microsporus var. microsporus]
MAPKKKQSSSLGRAVIKSRFQGQKAFGVDEGKLQHTTDIDEGPKWVKMQSITQENDLEAFLSTAALADTDFTAERLNVKVIQNDYTNPLLMDDDEDQKRRIAKQEASIDRLSVPRRPHWDKSMTAEQVQRNERESFLNWRRSMAQLEDEEGLLLTPFERNIEVWRQLWRVIERSQLVVQIVDARNPLLFRSADLEKYVIEVDAEKRNLLLINKADYLTVDQRKQWADYFESKGIEYAFFSAALAAKSKLEEEEKLREEELKEAKDKEQDNEGKNQEKPKEEDSVETISDYLSRASLSHTQNDDERIRIRTTTDLLDLLIEKTPASKDEKITIGLVGYPNVGKSSTINALIGEKRVSVSSTPGKTKHFQTIHLTPSLILCDCPGLVFPTFSTTKADQVCNGVLPIDQLREHAGPCGLVAQRIPKAVLEATYGIRIRTVPVEDGGTGIPTSSELCSTYAIARGYFKSSQGNPDEARAARYILKDYVNGKLLFCHPPPGVDALEFNKEIHEAALKVFKKAAPTTRVPSSALNYVSPAQGGTKTAAVDKAFFEKQLSSPHISGKGALTGGRVTLYPHQRLLADDGTPLPMTRKERAAIVQSQLGDMGSKKHKKGKKHVKVRSGAGYDYM